MMNATVPVAPTTAEQARTAHPDQIVRVYVGTPLGSPTREGVLHNYRRAAYAVAQLIEEGTAPLAPHLLYTQVLDEHRPEHRALGINLDLALMTLCQRVVLFTPDGTPETLTSGMRKDLERAVELGLPLEYRTLPEVPAGWSPSFLTAGGYYLRALEEAV